MIARMRALTAEARRLWQGKGKNLMQGGLAGVGITLGNRLFTMANSILLARLLGSNGYGIYASAIATMMVLTIVSEFGMYNLLIREVASAHNSDDWPKIAALGRTSLLSVTVISLLIGMTGYVLIWRVSLTFDLNEKLALTLVLFLLPINTLLRLGSAILTGLRRLKSAQLGELFLFPVLLFCTLVTLFAVGIRKWQPDQAILAQIGASAGALILIVLMIRSAFSSNIRVTGGWFVRGLQRRAIPFFAIGAAGTIAQQIDTVIVSAFLTHQEVAHYRVASQAATLTWFGIQILQAITAPYFAGLHQRGARRALQKVYTWATALGILSALPVFLLFVLYGRILIALAFGQEFTAAQTPLLIISLGYLLNVACGPAGTFLSMTGDEVFASRVFIIISSVSVTISLALVHLLGAPGVAIGTAFGFASYHLVLRFRIWRTHRF